MRTIYIFLLIWGSFFSLQGQRNDIDPDQSKNFKKAIRQLKRFNYYQAIPYFEESLNEKAEDALRLFYLGKCYYETHQEYKALEYLDRAYQKKPSAHPQLPYYAARIYHIANRFDMALDAYEKALPKAEDDQQRAEIQLAIKQCSTALQLVENSKSQVTYKFENMGNFINSKFSDYSPIFNSKMTQVMFTSRRPRKPVQKHNKKFYSDDIFEDIYFGKLSNGIWHKVQLASKKLPSTRHDATVFSNNTLSELYLYRSKRKLGDILITKLNNDKWSTPKPLLGEINTQYREASFFVASNGKIAYFSSDRPGGKGGLDIYYVKKTGENTWTGAKLLNINSKYDEDAPFFDGEYLYFSSRRPESMGGYDIFRAKMISETEFEEPENLGFPFNSGGDDIYFHYYSDSNKVTLSSNRLGGLGLMDNYIVDLNQEIHPEPYQDIGCDSLITLLDELKEKLKNTQFSENNTVASTEGGIIVLSGNIVDNVNDAPIKNSTIKLIDPINNQLIEEQKVSGTSANYKFSISSGRNYRIIVEAPGYLKFSEDFTVPISNKNDAHIKIIPLQKSNSMKSIVLGWQFFNYNTAELSSDRKDELDNLAVIMKSNPEIKIKLIGHTDGDGSDLFNNNLSLKRANAVADYLIKKGVEKERIQTEGKGKREPLYDNNSRFKKWNRRVEVYILN